MKRKIFSIVLMASLAFVLLSSACLNYFSLNKVDNTRTIRVTSQEIIYQNILSDFENSELKIEGSLATFDGTKPITLNDLSYIDNVCASDFDKEDEGIVKYHFSYDKDSNIVTISAEMKNEKGEIYIDEITGIAFINSNNEIDAVMNVEGESVLLSEMNSAGLINNCGWFSRLVKKVVKVAIITVVAAAVVAVTAAVVVCTAGAAAPALIAAGVGITTSTATAAGIGLGVAAGALFFSTIGIAALQAGTAISEPIAEGVSQLIDKTTGALLEIIYKGVSYASVLLTSAIISTLAQNAYFLALAAKDGRMYYSPVAIDRVFAVSIMQFNSAVSVYTFLEKNARSIAQEASINKSPLFDYAHDIGYFNHYHLGNLSNYGERHDICKSHAFFDWPQFN